MKQKLTVRAIIKQDDRILLLRRAVGNKSRLGKYELPGGKIEFTEHPLDALHREVREEAGVGIETAQLVDLLSYQDAEQPDVQRLVAVYTASLKPAERTVALSPEHDKYVWKRRSDIELPTVTESTILALHLSHLPSTTEVVSQRDNEDPEQSDGSYQKVIVYSDGGSRGNPGPSAAGFVVMDTAENAIFEGGKYLGVTTNNQAEYQGVYLGLLKAQELGAKAVDFRIDSMLVVNQLNGQYKIKNRELWPVHARIKELAASFDRVSFTHVRREFNQLADGMVNKTLDQRADR